MARLSTTGSLMCGVFVLAGSLTASAAQAPQGQARGGGAPQPPQNLQVLPKDMARAQVVTVLPTPRLPKPWELEVGSSEVDWELTSSNARIQTFRGGVG